MVRVAVKALTSKTPGIEDYEMVDEYKPESSDAYVENTKKRKSQKTQPMPHAKRQRTGANQGTPAKGGRRRKTLSLLPTMPLDVLFEIFSHLSAQDLLNLARTNKMLKETMLAPQTKGVWKMVRAVYEAPDPAVGLSEAKWASLLFELNCNCCAKRNVSNIDWNLQKRLCCACRQSSLVEEEDLDFNKVFKDYDRDMFNYIPHTNERTRRDRSDRNRHPRKLFYVDDVHVFAKKWSSACDAAQHSQEGRVAFDTWKEERKRMLQSINEMAGKYNGWVVSYERQKHEEKVDTSKVRLEAIKKRLLAAGYSSADIDSALHKCADGIITGSANVTNSAWTRIRPRYEPLVVETRNRRIFKEMRDPIMRRFQLLKEAYNEHIKHRSPAQRYCCPPAEFLWRYSNVSSPEADSTVAITTETFQSAIGKMDERIAEYQAVKKKEAVESARVAVSETNTRVDESLHLARQVFQCEHESPSSSGADANVPTTYQTLIGWDMITWLPSVKRLGFELRPGLNVDRPSKVQYNDRGSKVCSRLIVMAGLKSATATIADMDARDPRYVLRRSAFLFHLRIDTYPVFTWRAALYFVADKYVRDRDPPEFRLATPEETDSARQHSAALQGSIKAWSCNHCHDFFYKELARSKPTIVQHVKDKHGVSNPQVKKDYIVNPCLWQDLEAPYWAPLQVTSPECFKCKVCPDEATARFDKNEVLRHLNKRHQIASPLTGVQHFQVDPEMIIHKVQVESSFDP